MIAINVRGTGGSGKSTLVRRVMGHYRSEPLRREGRRRPLGYHLEGAGASPLYVPGHYETACGGCDTIKTPGEVYDLINLALTDVQGSTGHSYDVLYEGIMVMDDVRRAVELDKWLKRMPSGEPLRNRLYVIYLTTPIEECLAAIRARREARGDTRPLDPRNTVDRKRRAEGGLRRLREAGISVECLSREDAFTRVCGLLRLTPAAT